MYLEPARGATTHPEPGCHACILPPAMTTNAAFNRLEMLTGREGLAKLRDTRVVLFGVGGVGSWCAEALVRSGIGHLTIVDSDLICVTNINRQLQATWETVGKPKVSALADRLRTLNPSAEIVARQEIFCADTAAAFPLGEYDYVLDAIDSVSAKVFLLDCALAAGVKVFSSLGASCKLDATRIRVSSLWKTHGCPLGKFVRKRLRKRLRLRGASGSILCVHSTEMREQFATQAGCGTGVCLCPKTLDENGEPAHEWCSSKKQINGSAVHITGTFGFMLAGLVIQDVVQAHAPEADGGLAGPVADDAPEQT